MIYKIIYNAISIPTNFTINSRGYYKELCRNLYRQSIYGRIVGFWTVYVSDIKIERFAYFDLRFNVITIMNFHHHPFLKKKQCSAVV
jgi:hypothetical protein